MTKFVKAMTSTTKQGWKGHAERGLNMKLLGHDVPKTFVLLSTFEGFLFLFLVHAVSEANLSFFGGAGAPLNLAFKIILTAIFLLIGTSIGLFNREATQSFGNYLRRLAITWPVILLTGAYLVASDRLFIQAALPGAMLLDLALQLTLVMLTIFAARVALVWGIGLAFLQTRVMVLGDGALADAVTRFVEGPGRGQFRHLQTIRDWSPATAGLPGSIIGNLRLAALPVGAPLSALAEMLKAEEIIVAVEDRTVLPLAELLECKLKGIGVIDALTFWERESGQIDADVVGEGWLAFGGGFALSQRRRLLKRSADLLISLTFLVAIAPLCLLVALIVKLESAGPIFYRQERVGLNARRGRGRRRSPLGDHTRRSGHGLWTIHPQVPHRRDPAGSERSLGRDELHRSPPRTPLLRRSAQAADSLLRHASPGSAGDHRLGAGELSLRRVDRGREAQVGLRPLLPEERRPSS
jgi:hypothetical protein